MSVIEHVTDTVQPGTTGKLAMTFDRPASFTLLNHSGLAVYGAFDRNPPAGFQDAAWVCPPMKGLTLNSDSQWLAWIFDPSGAATHVAGAAGVASLRDVRFGGGGPALLPAVADHYSLTVVDQPQAPGVFALDVGIADSGNVGAFNGWNGLLRITNPDIVITAPPGRGRLLVVENQTDQPSNLLNVSGTVLSPIAGRRTLPFLIYTSGTPIPAGAAVVVGEDQSATLANGAYDQLVVHVEYGASPSAGGAVFAFIYAQS